MPRCWPTASSTASTTDRPPPRGTILLAPLRTYWPGLLLAAALPAAAQTIYSCVDAQGRRLTADRPIMECLDREQVEYGSSGVVRARRGPALSTQERVAQEEKARKAEEDRVRADELRRRDQALLARYPDEASHQRAREATLRAVADAGERQRLDARYDEERTRLRGLWGQPVAPVAAASAAVRR